MRERGAGLAGREAGSRPRQAALDPQRPVEALYGSRSERQKKPGTGRKRGQQRGAAGHGRTQRPGLGQKKEPRDPPEDARVCPRCGKPYAANGERCTTLVEIDVEAYENTIVRSRWRRSCECPSSPRDVTAPPVARLFDTTPYGISVWVCMLYERFVCCRPLHRVAAWLADMGLAISPGTLADSIKRFVPLFEPLAEEILAHQNEAALRHADETSWRVQAYREKGRSSRAWLWTSVSPDAVYFHIDPSRSAEVAMKLFGSTKGIVVLVCDRYSAYKKLARELAGKVRGSAVAGRAARVLADLPRDAGNPWVIAGRKPGSRLSHIVYYWYRVRERAELDDVRIHDLRHSFASRALALGREPADDRQAAWSQQDPDDGPLRPSRARFGAGIGGPGCRQHRRGHTALKLRSPTSARTSSPSCAAACPSTGPSATAPLPC